MSGPLVKPAVSGAPGPVLLTSVLATNVVDPDPL
jgi:hypothetical protein